MGSFGVCLNQDLQDYGIFGIGGFSTNEAKGV